MTDTLAIRGGRLFTGDGFEQADVIVAGGLVAQGEPDRTDVTVRADGLLVAPG